MSDTNRRSKPFNYRETRDDEPLYVRNCSAIPADPDRDFEGRVSGDILISIKVDDNLEALVVKNTWLPQDLSNAFLPSVILRNNEFRSQVNRGIIEVIEPSLAEAELQTTRARAEQRRLEALLAERGQPARSIAEPVIDPQDRQGGAHRPVPTMQHREAAAPVQSRALESPNLGLEVIDRYNKGVVTEEEAATSLKAVAPMLSPSEITRVKQLQNLPAVLLDAVAAL